MSNKPGNLKKVKILEDGRSLHGLNPYVDFDADEKPLRITLDGNFGIEDIRWLLQWMSAQQENAPAGDGEISEEK